MRFVREQSFGAHNEPYEAILSGIRGEMAVDGDGNLYLVVDGPRLLSFGPGGALRWSVERQGEGPGELRSTAGVAWGGADRIYVGNAGATRVDVWSTGGEFLRSQVLAELGPAVAAIAGFVTPERLVLRTLGGRLEGAVGQALTLVNVGPRWSLRADTIVSVNADFRPPEDRSIGVDLATYLDGTIALGNVGAYELHFLDDEDLELRRIVTVDTDRIVRPGRIRWIVGTVSPVTGSS